MDVTVREVGLAEARTLPPIPSSYETGEACELRRSAHPGGETWTLLRAHLPTRTTTVYDTGELDDWIETYAEEPGLSRLRFMVADHLGQTVGLLAWAHSDWNETVWLVDIRVLAEKKRSGIGGALLAALIGHARLLPVRGIHVETQIRNAPAIDFYRSCGFEVSGFNEHLYSNAGLEEQDVAVYLFLSTAQEE